MEEKTKKLDEINKSLKECQESQEKKNRYRKLFKTWKAKETIQDLKMKMEAVKKTQMEEIM